MDTAKLVAFDASKAFSQMHQRGDMGGPMLFSGLGMMIGILAFFAWMALIGVLGAASSNAPGAVYGIIFFVILFYVAITIFIVVPVSATLGNMIGAGILHVCLMICGGSKHPFDTSFRIQCYVSGSLMLAMIFPPILGLLWIWQIICTITAVQKAHEVPYGRAAMAVLLPFIVMVALNAILFFLMASLGAAASLR